MNSQARVAIVGAGPGGLVAAKWLKQYGFEPVIFEQSDDVGGQWNARAPYSGVWSSMSTNTSRLTTSFSDLQYESGTPVFPSNQQVHAYLKRYVTQFELNSHLRLHTQIKQIEHTSTSNEWMITSTTQAGELQIESFPYVVIASGRYNKPTIPFISGLDAFSGTGGMIHTFQYKDPDRYRGQRVLVAGGNIIAQEMPMHHMALLFARSAGVEPELHQWMNHLRALLFGPLSATSFRLSGPDSLPDATQRFAEEVVAFSAVPSPELTPEQQAQLEALVTMTDNPGLAQVSNQLRLQNFATAQGL